RAVEHASALVELDLVLREVRGLDPVSERPAQQLLEQRRLAGPVRADERHVLATLDRERHVREQVLVAGRQLEVLHLDDRPPAAGRVEELEAERPPAARQQRQLLGGLATLLLEARDLRQLRLRLPGRS